MLLFSCYKYSVFYLIFKILVNIKQGANMYFPHVCPIGSDAARRAATFLVDHLAIHVRDLLG